MNNAPPSAIEFTRGSIVESVHRAHISIVDSSGKTVFTLGDPEYVTYMRSSAKPLQALSVLVSGTAEHFGLNDAELAVISGSHGGEPWHIEAVKSILHKAGLDHTFLQCGTHQPLDSQARRNLRIEGKEPIPLHHNCSGKHTGMLATAKHLDEPLDSYLDQEGPTQKRITNLIAMMAGIKSEDVVIGIDGCGAPVHGLPMRAAALAFARLVDPSVLLERKNDTKHDSKKDDKAEIAIAAQRISRVMRAYPEMVAANQERICTELMRIGRVFELTAKSGAEGFYSAAWRDPQTGHGIGMALKVEDGAQRGRDPLIISILQKFGILPSQLGQNLKNFAPRSILNNRGEEVGNIIVRI